MLFKHYQIRHQFLGCVKNAAQANDLYNQDTLDKNRCKITPLLYKLDKSDVDWLRVHIGKLVEDLRTKSHKLMVEADSQQFTVEGLAHKVSLSNRDHTIQNQMKLALYLNETLSDAPCLQESASYKTLNKN